MRFSAARASVITSVCTFAATGKFVGCATMSAPFERERARHLGEAEVVADLDADPAERRVPDVELVAGRDEAVDAEERQVRLPVRADQARRGRRGRRRCGAGRRRARAGRRRRACRAARTRAPAPRRRRARASPRRTTGPPRGCRTCSPGSRTRAARAARAPAAAASSSRAEAGLEVPLRLAELRVELGHRDPRHEASLTSDIAVLARGRARRTGRTSGSRPTFRISSTPRGTSASAR